MGTTTYEYDGETVIVTGGSSGIGRAIARRFGEAGARVLVADVREDPKDRGAETPTHEVIEESGGSAAYVETDVSDPAAIRAVVEAAREFGGVDVMVNNAGVHVSRAFLDVTPEDLALVHGVNARGVFFGTQAAARDMRERGEGGTIVNTASTTSEFAAREHSHYGATKGAVKMITRGAALELAPEIRVNAVAPGPIATEITEGWSERASDAVGGDGGLPTRAGTPADVAGAVCWLASADADYVTGEMVFVDGGAHAV